MQRTITCNLEINSREKFWRHEEEFEKEGMERENWESGGGDKDFFSFFSVLNK